MFFFVLFRTCGRGAIVWHNWSIRSSLTIWFAVFNTNPLVWLVLESNNFQHGKFHSHCTIHTASVRTEWGIFCSHYFYLIFHKNLSASTCPYCKLLYISDFILPAHHLFWVDDSCTCHKISLPSCTWVTTTNIGHP